METVLNAFALIASVLGLALPLHLLRYGQPRSKAEKRRLSRNYVICWVVGGVCLSFFGFQFSKAISTKRQSGDFANYPTGVSDVIYAIPYKTRPHLRVMLKSQYSIGGSAAIVEQRTDGFKVQLSSLADHWKWEADGIPAVPKG